MAYRLTIIFLSGFEHNSYDYKYITGRRNRQKSKSSRVIFHTAAAAAAGAAAAAVAAPTEYDIILYRFDISVGSFVVRVAE